MRRSAVQNPPLLVLAAVLAVATAGCFAHTVREDVFESGDTRIYLRASKKGGELVDRGFGHPAAIAPVRMAYILSRIDLRVPGRKLLLARKKEKDRIEAIPTDLLYVVGEGLSQALAKATPAQEVVAQVVREDRSLFVFDHKYLTNFVAYVKDDVLYIHMNRFDWEIPRGRNRDKLPEPEVGEHPMKFSVLPSEAMLRVDPQSVAVAWRDDIFARPTRTRLLPSGRVVRKTILMDMETTEPVDELPPEEQPVPRDSLPADLSPEALRDLADLEELRDRGLVTEAEYQQRRREIVTGDGASD